MAANLFLAPTSTTRLSFQSEFTLESDLNAGERAFFVLILSLENYIFVYQEFENFCHADGNRPSFLDDLGDSEYIFGLILASIQWLDPSAIIEKMWNAFCFLANGNNSVFFLFGQHSHPRIVLIISFIVFVLLQFWF